MKTLCTLLCCCIIFSATGKNATFEKLVSVNKCWTEQKDIDPAALPAYGSADEHEWIARHLALVEQTLRARNTDALTATQKHNRTLCLNNLHSYRQQGNFPVNETYSYRTPIFIDKHDNFCAVGYLVKASGHEDISRMIAANTNLAYVHDMKYPELKKWAHDYGFTIDELAWIQPSYPSPVHSKPIARGVNGEVMELFTDATADRLYVGGSFTTADGSVAASNIAYVTETSPDVYTWHSMATGLNGPVHAIMKLETQVFAAGSFTMAGDSTVNNVAWWDGTVWHSAGCISGTVNSMAVFNSELYAAGSFSVCASAGSTSFAKWNGSNWQPITGITGTVNVLRVMDTTLMIGGAFAYSSGSVNAIRWNATSGFMPFSGAIANEVRDIALYQDTMYAVCKRTSTAADSTNLFLKLNGNTWNTAYTSASSGIPAIQPYVGTLSFNTLCPEAETLNIGGQFQYFPMVGYTAANCFSVGGGWFVVDSAINKMVMFHSDLIAGGKFKLGDNSTMEWGLAVDTLNGMAKRSIPPLSVSTLTAQSFSLYPNPAMAAAPLTISNNFNATHFTVRDITAKVQAEGTIANGSTSQITLPALAAGMYFVDMSNEQGARVVKKLIVQ